MTTLGQGAPGAVGSSFSLFQAASSSS